MAGKIVMNREVEEEKRKAQGGTGRGDNRGESWRSWKIGRRLLGSFHSLLELLEHVTFRVRNFHLDSANEHQHWLIIKKSTNLRNFSIAKYDSCMPDFIMFRLSAADEQTV
jgi:hypothetical protein